MTASGAVKMVPIIRGARSPPRKPPGGEPIKREEPERERDIDHRDCAGGLVVRFLDRLVIDQERQRDDALGADEQDDPEFVDGKEQAKAAASDRGGKGGWQNDAAHDPPGLGSEKTGEFDLALVDK